MRAATTLSLLASIGPISATVLPLTRRQQANPKPIVLTENGVVFEVEVQVNNQTFYLIPDTGSSDVWIPVSDFQCVDPETAQDIPQEECHFGRTYTVPHSTEYVANQTFGVQYGDGIAVGKVAYADVTLNGITMPHQKIGLVERTNDVFDGIGSGVLGLGFRPLTSAHPGTELDNTTLLVNRAPYDPVFVAMYKKGLVQPWYSFAFERPPNNATSGPGGWLGLGELPPVAYEDDWAVKPIEVTEGLPDELTDGKREITLMTLTVDGISWGSASNGARTTNSTPFQAVVDTGNHLNLVPVEIAESVNAAFDPPGTFSEDLAVYVVDCNVSTPAFGVTLDGHTFWHQRREDLVYRDAEGGFCYSSVAPTGEGSGLSLNFLGDAFLRNVVSVYDFGKNEMRFATRLSDGQAGSNLTVPMSRAGVSFTPPWLLVISAGALAYFL
ncbi:hypothetical protein ANO14919_099550 [Xylariales sp. No.14919]|nr:hypothetical protein ANO14919_099550 [Xylariales sp. No.14919]